MNEQKRKIPSIASLFPDLAWNLLTSEQQRQLLEYLEKAYNHERNRIKKKVITSSEKEAIG